MDYSKQNKEVINGVSYNYLCHYENVSGAGNVYPAHYHSYIEILYGVSGEYEVILNGKYYEFTSGDLVIINSREVHQINSLSVNGGQYIVLRFEPEIIYNSMFSSHLHLKYVLPFILETNNHQKIVKKEEIQGTFIPELLFDMLDEFESKAYGYELAIKNHIGRIFLWLLRYFHRNGSDFSITSDSKIDNLKRLQPAFDYIQLHYDEAFSATDLALLCNMSLSYFSRIFNTEIGMSLNEYINYIRITEAEKLLISTSMNITEVANAVGFNTTSYFIKIFKVYKNISPKQFRNELTISQV